MTSDGALSTLLLLLAERHLDAVRCWPEAAGGGARGAFLVTHAVVRGGGSVGGGVGIRAFLVAHAVVRGEVWERVW